MNIIFKGNEYTVWKADNKIYRQNNYDGKLYYEKDGQWIEIASILDTIDDSFYESPFV